MQRIYNFNAGPAMVPAEVLSVAQAEFLNWHDIGMSVMEISHRSADFKSIMAQTEQDLRELMQISNDYTVLFLAGGASIHFSMIPLNLLQGAGSADYFDTGIWSKKAILEGSRYCQTNIVASVKKEEVSFIQPSNEWQLNKDAAYVHYTPNETIEGIEFHTIPKTGDVPLVADMTSMILSKRIDVSKFGLIYAGVQKNLGQAGLNVVIIRNDLLKTPHLYTPSPYNYKLQAESQGLYNTPPTYAWYITSLVLAWMKQKGGVEYFEQVNQRKAQSLYHCIDKHSDFYSNTIDQSCRSSMNVVFNLQNSDLVPVFLKMAQSNNLANLRGHIKVGGIRASIYNAMPEAGVNALVQFMEEFVRTKG